MTVSVFDLFSIGIGPSSSHTVGPMRAANRFVADLDDRGLLDKTTAVDIRLYGSLAATGVGHGTVPAVLVGLAGRRPEEVTPEEIAARMADLRTRGRLALAGRVSVPMSEQDIARHPLTVLPGHPNGMVLAARDPAGEVSYEQTYYSTGGGFVATADELGSRGELPSAPPGPFRTAAELLRRCAETGSAVSDVMLRFEATRRPAAQVREYLLRIRDVMWECVRRGVHAEGELPGGLGVRRRAPDWYRRLSVEDPDHRDPALAEDWVNLVAMAVNEENAAGGRVVTAPTNGAAGIIPAVLHYATHYTAAGVADPDEVAVRFLLTAGAIGSLYKERASISGAEVGCQGEVGSASSMAAAGLAEVLGGTPAQVENAAEIAMEHSLGMTCDPVGGLVQIPCIERNAIAAGKAVNAARMALRGDGTHRVSLDEVIAAMRETGRDMSDKYKETARGGLAVAVVPVNVVEC
ncbi:MAG TPA: L-serine ammonia-lyase [Natronosporangium sp.]|nr:L-serine ammonia-lyase [Natronosporangium sp.]